MKRVCLVILMLLLTAALAENMVVVNCDEWVSLRETPSISAKRLLKVPLNETVYDCESAEGDFIRCTYEGATGYILAKYLKPADPEGMETVIDEALPDYGVTIRAIRRLIDGEQMTVTACDATGAMLWSFDTETRETTELTATDAFLGGTSEDPRVLVYNSREGLRSLDLRTGEEGWFLSTEAVHLGAGNSHAVDEEGRIYIAGYYGPDPVCIDMNGNVIWKSSSGSDDIYWPYRISIESRGIVTQYSMMDTQTEGRVIYDPADGHVIGREYD